MKSISRIFGSIVFRLLQLLSYATRLTPYFVKSAVASVGAFIWLYLIGFRRRIILLNLSHAFPRQKEEANEDFKNRIFKLAYENLRNYFLGIFEILEKVTWSDKSLARNVTMTGIENIREYTDKGQGVFLLTAHTGNWELAIAIGSQVGRPLDVIVRYVRNSFWDEILKRSREQFEVKLLGENSSGIAAMRACKKGEIVAFVLDQHTGEPHGVKVKFFGMEAWTAKGLAILSSRMHAPVLPVFSYREKGRVYVVIEKAMDFSDLGECLQESQIFEHVQRCNDKIEAWVRRYPEQYFWIHRRFKASLDYTQYQLPF